MSSTGGSGASPFIAGAGMPGGDFHEPIDDDFFNSNTIFDVENSPDTLQSLDTISAGGHKQLLSSQELAASGPVPDSPNDSFQDSSSESAASWRRHGSSASTSAKTPANSGNIMMENAKMDWDGTNFGGFDGFVGGDMFVGQNGSSPDDEVNFDFSPKNQDQDDSFMDQSFDFESASNSPRNASASNSAVEQPLKSASNPNTMPTKAPANTTASTKSRKTSTPRSAKPRTQQHKKQYSVSLFFC